MSSENGAHDRDDCPPYVQELSIDALARRQCRRNQLDAKSGPLMEFASLLPDPVHQDHPLPSKLEYRRRQPDTIPSPQRSRTRHLLSSVWNWAWFIEFLAMLTTISMVMSIGIVLKHYHEQPVPQLAFNININTVIAIIATLMRATLLYVLIQVLGQVRWSWFSSPRPLYDLHHFDQGGQSLFGSCKLVVHMVRAGLGCLDGVVTIIAAVTLVVGFAITPFVQQAVKTLPCEKDLGPGTATIPVAQYVPWPNGRPKSPSGRYNNDVPQNLRGAMISSLANPAQDIPVVQPSCSTGNCTFPPYSSMGLCSVCIDITEQIIRGPMPTNSGSSEGTHLNFSIPNGRENYNWLNTRYITYPNKKTVAPVGLSVSYIHDDANKTALGNWPLDVNAIARVDMLAFSDSPCSKIQNGGKRCPREVVIEDYPSDTTTNVVAISCKMYPCIRTYNASVQFGVFKEELLSSVSTNLITTHRNADSLTLSEVGRGDSFVGLGSPCTTFNSDTYTNANITKYSPKSNEKYLNTTVFNPGQQFNPANVIKMPRECVYHLDQEYMEWMRNFMGNKIFGFDNRCTLGESRDRAKISETVACDNWWLGQLYNDRNATKETVVKTMDAFTKSISDQFRVMGKWPDEEYNQEILPNNSTGTAARTTICLTFAWEWLLLPAVLIGITMMLLAITIIKSHRHADWQPIWKGSVLPLVMYGLGDASMRERDSVPDVDRHDQEPDVETEPKSIVPLHVVEETAKKIKVRFRGTKSGFEVVTDQTRA
ncbi:hypothetical protein PspLS_01161 [Pyricularia sp. CBS 133598]|nr:hypothetical protein PspLS_01161 [Pyricularia sp. CBS 133598]